MTGLTLCAAFAATTALAANGSYTTQSNAFVKWGNCAQEPQTCDGLEAASCQQKAQQTCDNDSECVGFTIRNHIGFWDDFLTYTDKTCVDENTYDDGHWTLHTKAAPAAPAGVNIAPLGKATQSTTAYNGVASRAIDGNTDGVYSAAHGSVTHTSGPKSWWQVALDETYQINDIRIYNRTGSREEVLLRLNQFSVEILEDGQVVKSFGPFQAFSGDYFDVPGVNGATGNKVRISIPGHYLSLAEVEVYGERAKGAQADATDPNPAAPAGDGSTYCGDNTKWDGKKCVTSATAGPGTMLVDGVCTVSPKTCPDKTEYNHITNECQSLLKGVCAMETEDGTFHDTAKGPWTDYCSLPDGTDCGAPDPVNGEWGADPEVSKACDHVRNWWKNYLKNDPATTARTMCVDTFRWWQEWESAGRPANSNHAILRGRIGIQPLWDHCATLNGAGMRTIRRLGARSNSQ